MFDLEKKIILLFGICFSFLLNPCSLFASLEDYFKKPIEEKSNIHSLPEIDFIYMINLDRRTEKFSLSLKELEPFNIYPYRFSAIDRNDLSLEVINDIGVKYNPKIHKSFLATSYPFSKDPVHEVIQMPERTYFSHHLAINCMAITLSHLSVLQDAIDSGYETIWVMEDDINVVEDPHILSEIIQELDQIVGKENWDVLFTDPDTKNINGEYIPCGGYPNTGVVQMPNFSPKNLDKYAVCKVLDENPLIKKIGARFGAYSVIIRRSGMAKILNFIKEYKIFFPYDIAFFLPENINLYSLTKDIVSTKIDAISDNH